MHRKHVYGPVPSRRFGLSLGVDVVPSKVCTLDCIYCQVGPTSKLSVTRELFFPPEEIAHDILQAIQQGPVPNIITFAGSGEPTLYSGLGDIVRLLRTKTSIPLLLITNGTLLHRPDVAADAMLFDRVAPSLDAADSHTFATINQPHPDLNLKEIIHGLHSFAAAFKGELDLELFFLQGVNDSPESVAALVQAVDYIAPSRVDLNTAVRPSPQRCVQRTSPEFFASLLGRFSVPANSVLPPLPSSDQSDAPHSPTKQSPLPTSGNPDRNVASSYRPGDKGPQCATPLSPEATGHNASAAHDDQSAQTRILLTLERRPCTAQDLALALGLPLRNVETSLASLLSHDRIASEVRQNQTYFFGNHDDDQPE